MTTNNDLTTVPTIRFGPQLAWITRWQPADALALDVRVGRRFETDLRYRLQDGSSANVEVPDTSFFGFSVSARF